MISLISKLRMLFVLTVLTVISPIAKSQVVINLQLPPLGLSVKSQLWNLALINTGQPVEVQVQVVISKPRSNDKILTGITHKFTLPRGLKQVRSSEMIPTYNVINSAFNVDASPNGFLPIGSFDICYSIIKSNSVLDYVESLGEECETVEVEPLSPPVLISPFDGEKIESLNPTFSWLPPAPLALFSNLTYTLKLVTVDGLQTPEQALQQNMSIISNTNLPNTVFLFGSTLGSLDTGRTYAWQVTALSNNNAIAFSESWTFKPLTRTDSALSKTRTTYYTKLRREDDGAYAVAIDYLNYQYVNEINDSIVSVQLIDITSPSRQSPFKVTEKKVVFGENYINEDLRELANISINHIYLLVLSNSKNEKWYMKFLFKRSN